MDKSMIILSSNHENIFDTFSINEFTPINNSEEWSENHNSGFPHICCVGGKIKNLHATAYFSFSDDEMEACNGDIGMLDWDHGLDYVEIDVENLEDRLAAGETVEFNPGCYIEKAGQEYIVTTNTGLNRYYWSLEDALLDEGGEDVEEEDIED